MSVPDACPNSSQTQNPFQTSSKQEGQQEGRIFRRFCRRIPNGNYLACIENRIFRGNWPTEYSECLVIPLDKKNAIKKALEMKERREKGYDECKKYSNFCFKEKINAFVLPVPRYLNFLPSSVSSELIRKFYMDGKNYFIYPEEKEQDI